MLRRARCVLRLASGAGTVRLQVFSDAARTRLVDTLTVAVGAARTWRYLFGANSYNDGTTGTLSFDVEHLGLARGAAKDYYYNEAWQVLEERKDEAATVSYTHLTLPTN